MTHKFVFEVWRLPGDTRKISTQMTWLPQSYNQGSAASCEPIRLNENHSPHEHSSTTANAAPLQSKLRHNLILAVVSQKLLNVGCGRTAVLSNPPLRRHNKITVLGQGVYMNTCWFDLEFFVEWIATLLPLVSGSILYRWKKPSLKNISFSNTILNWIENIFHIPITFLKSILS